MRVWGTVKEKKSVHSAGRRASLGQGLLTPGPRAGRRWLAAVLSWGDEAGSGLPGPSGQKAPQRPALPPSPCENTKTQKPGPRATRRERPVCDKRSRQIRV